MITELTDDNLQELLLSNDRVVVQYSAGWCGNCRMMKPKMKKMAEENQSIKFIIADAEKFPASRKFAKVDNLPTFAIFHKSNLVNQVQTNKIEVLKNLVNEIASN